MARPRGVVRNVENRQRMAIISQITYSPTLRATYCITSKPSCHNVDGFHGRCRMAFHQSRRRTASRQGQTRHLWSVQARTDRRWPVSRASTRLTDSTSARPSIFSLTARAKHDAWEQASKRPLPDAEAEYIRIAQELGWKGEEGRGVRVSTIAPVDAEPPLDLFTDIHRRDENVSVYRHH